MMCGYVNYQDPRLIPPDINDVDEYDHSQCQHWAACLRQYKLRGGVEGVDTMETADQLDCEDCDEWEEA